MQPCLAVLMHAAQARLTAVAMSCRWGKFISMTAGCYVGTQIGIRGIKERCLERIVALPTPLGIEAAAILRDKVSPVAMHLLQH